MGEHQKVRPVFEKIAVPRKMGHWDKIKESWK